jgi:hypothetical protein
MTGMLRARVEQWPSHQEAQHDRLKVVPQQRARNAPLVEKIRVGQPGREGRGGVQEH